MTEQPATTIESEPAGFLSRRQTVFMVAALVLSVISFMLNATMLSPAIGDINAHLGHNAFASMSSYSYLAGAIANVVLIRWSDYIGRKRVLIGVLIMMCIGTLLCLFGTSLPVVVAGRVLQGASNVTFGLAFLIMRERLTAAVFGVCCGILSAVNGGVAGTDALLGGFLVDHFGYRSIFVLTLIIGIASVALGWKAVPADESERVTPGRMDWVGAVLIAVTVAGITLFIGNGGDLGWSSPFVVACIAAAIVAFVAFVVVEKRVVYPLVHIDELRSRYAWPVIAVTILSFASFMVVLGFLIPSIAENRSVGFSANGMTTALLFITPAALVQLVVAPLIGRLAVRIGWVTVLRAGLVCALAATALLAVFALDRNMAILLMLVFGASMGVALTPLAALGVIQAPEDEPGSLPGISNAAFGIGGSLGFAWAGTVVGEGTKASYHSALWIAVAIGIAAFATSLILKPRDAAV
ncbi:MFS transporter [Mycobacterium sp.]|jgi:MFS family permease|uniref:MFS transporter n=1 Tax=Mycobacterium sp. TaxID=1785 RepID=UPI002CECE2E7|nr:MFS transporter [Mycobacterium sp.]HXB85162.1 MFS transporter [Mycobacterium sp.]